MDNESPDHKSFATIKVDDIAATDAINRILAEPVSGNVPALQVEGLVSSGEIDTTVASAQNAFNELETVRSQLTDGRTVEATSLFVPLSVNHEPHFVRLMRFMGPKNRPDPDVYVVFDATENADRILVRDPSIIKIESGDDHPKGIYVAQGIGNPDELNEREDVTFVEEVIQSLYKQHDRIEIEKVHATQEAAELKIVQKAQERRATSLHRQAIRNTAKRIAKNVAKDVAAVTLVAAVGLGGIKGIQSKDWRDDREKFDDKSLVIEGGKVIGVDQAGSPEFSFKLLNDPQLKITGIPEVGNLKESPYDKSRGSSSDDDNEEMTNESNEVFSGKLREIVITSTSSGRSKEQTHVQLSSPNDTIKVWTDAQNPDNIRVSLAKDGVVTVERLDKETSPNDDVRVVIEHVPAPQSK